jgi:YebC/PmpR family DNA-binding regulatory protein
MGRAFEFRKARKLKRWSNMAKTFTRIGREIVITVKEGGADPSSNSRLRAVIQNAKNANMPKDNIERAINRASEKSNDDFKEILLEGYGPHGIAVLIEAATDNNNRTVANVRSYFNKFDGNLATSGSVEFLFYHNCYIEVSGQGIDIEELELKLIDFGVLEVTKSDDLITLISRFEDFGLIQKELEKRNLQIISSEFERLPKVTKNLNEEQKVKIDKLIDLIDEDDDVQNVYTDLE